jgi:aspartate/methionine/tyrosine aminotransferase
VDADAVTRAFEGSGLRSLSLASIREIKRLVDTIEGETGQRYIRMEMGIPGLPPSQIAVNAQIEALKRGVAAVYPDIQGIPALSARSRAS